MKPYREKYWGILWKSDNQLDGKTEHFIFGSFYEPRGPGPSLFKTRAEARAFRDKHYGYIRTREDLKREPHGWKLPRVVRVSATYTAAC
jgi:hypothetical protein